MGRHFLAYFFITAAKEVSRQRGETRINLLLQKYKSPAVAEKIRKNKPMLLLSQYQFFCCLLEHHWYASQ